MQDEAKVFARRLDAAGVTVTFDGFEGMPHCFAVIPWNKAGREAFENQAKFCRQAVTVEGVRKTDSACWTSKDGKKKLIRFEDLGMNREEEGRGRDAEQLDDETVDKLLKGNVIGRLSSNKR
jgi:hypothetical protein